MISPDGVRPYSGRAVSPDSVARRFGVGTMVTGSVRQDGDRLRVAVRLTDARTGVQMSSETFDEPVDSLLVLRDRLSGEVARQFRIRLGEQVTLQERRAGTTVAEAWNLLLRADRLRDQANGLSLAARDRYRQADSLLGMAAALDPPWPEPGETGSRRAARSAGRSGTGLRSRPRS